MNTFSGDFFFYCRTVLLLFLDLQVWRLADSRLIQKARQKHLQVPQWSPLGRVPPIWTTFRQWSFYDLYQANQCAASTSRGIRGTAMDSRSTTSCVHFVRVAKCVSWPTRWQSMVPLRAVESLPKCMQANSSPGGRISSNKWFILNISSRPRTWDYSSASAVLRATRAWTLLQWWKIWRQRDSHPPEFQRRVVLQEALALSMCTTQSLVLSWYS